MKKVSFERRADPNDKDAWVKETYQAGYVGAKGKRHAIDQKGHAICQVRPTVTPDPGAEITCGSCLNTINHLRWLNGQYPGFWRNWQEE